MTCNDEVKSLQQDPTVSVLMSQVQVGCNQWANMTNRQQLAFAEAVVGGVNVVLRVRGETAACATESQSMRATDSAGSGLVSIASAYPNPVNVDLAKLPPTPSPGDPDRCNERTNSAPGSTNTQWIADGVGDRVAMGY